MKLYQIKVNDDKDYYKPTSEEVLTKIRKCLKDNNMMCKTVATEGNGTVMYFIYPMSDLDLDNAAQVANNLLADRGIRTDGFKVVDNKYLKCLISSDCFRL